MIITKAATCISSSSSSSSSNAYEEFTRLTETRLAQNTLNDIRLALNTLKNQPC